MFGWRTFKEAMSTSTPHPLPELLQSLAQELSSPALRERRMLAPSRAVGQQWLQAALLQTSCRGFVQLRVQTLFEAALEAAQPLLLRQRREVLEASGLAHLVGELLARGALLSLSGERQGRAGPGLAALAARALAELRLAGVTAETLRETAFENVRKGEGLRRLLALYEKELARRRLADRADIYRLAQEAPRASPVEEWWVLPGQCWRGLEKEFYQAVLAERALELPGEAVSGVALPGGSGAMGLVGSQAFSYLGGVRPPAVPPPAVDFFSAADESEELAEVLRRCAAEGRPLDEVQIVSAAVDAHGEALAALGAYLQFPFTLAEGKSLARYRCGAAARTLLDWIEEDASAAVLRRGFLSGCFDPFPDLAGSGLALAHILEKSGIGWGARRYRPRLAAYRRYREWAAQEEGESASWEGERETWQRLQALLESLLSALPPPAEEVAPAALAAFVGQALDRLLPPSADESEEEEARRRLTFALAEVVRWRTAPLPLSQALRLLREILETQHSGYANPAPGALHLSGLSQAVPGRRRYFLVGFSGDRFPPLPSNNPFLTHAEREKISPELPTAPQVLAEHQFALFHFLAAARGAVTISYSRAGGAGPALLFEQAAALLGGAGGEAGPAAARIVPAQPLFLPALDEARQRAARQALERGRQAAAERRSPRFTAADGQVQTAGELDPRKNPALGFSASRLERLGTCPRSYFFRYVLGVDAEEGLRYDPAHWLDPPLRGRLLHQLFERCARAAGSREQRVAAALSGALEEMRRDVPPPGELVFQLERQELLASLRLFAALEERRGRPLFLEKEFGPLPLPLPGGGACPLRGRIDRVERGGGGRLRVIDYKTGRSRDCQSGAPFRGGRQLQHALYRAAASRLVEDAREGGAVAESGYWFPTVGGEGVEVLYGEEACRPWPELLQSLLELLGGGIFPRAEETAPCRYCPYAAACGGEEEAAAMGEKLCGPDAARLEPFLKVRRYD